jgi:hypothetical protein
MTHIRGTPATPRQAVILGIAILIIGGVLGIVGGINGAQLLQFTQTSLRANGRVIRLDLVRKTYHPVVTFIDSNGSSFQFTDALGSQPAANKVGDSVTVIFPKGHPEQAKVDSLLATWISPLLPLICSAFWLISGSVVLWNGISRVRRSTT